MKKSLSTKAKSVETLPKAVADHRSRTIGQSRNEPTVRPSLHPWYYVKGRKDLTEKNISSRREREEQRHQQSVSNSQYFSKQSAETKLYHNWMDNKGLVKYSKSDAVLRPPYDVVVESKTDSRLKNKDLGRKYSKALQRLQEFVIKFKDMDEKYCKLETKQNNLVFQLNELREIKNNFEKKKNIYCEILSKGQKHFRFCRDKLRIKVFQIIDQLNYYKIEVKKIQRLKNCEGIVTKEELTELTEVIDRAIKILDMYIALNEKRNTEFLLMYDEEADNRWESQENEWQTEFEVWTLMTEKLIDSYYNVIKEKLKQLLTEESNALDERERVVKELKELVAKIRANSQMSWILEENFADLLIDENRSKESQTNGS